MSNNTSSLFSGNMSQDSKTIAFEIMVFLIFGGGLRGIYKWFKSKNFRFIITSNKGDCNFDCESVPEAIAPEQPEQPEVVVEENKV